MQENTRSEVEAAREEQPHRPAPAASHVPPSDDTTAVEPTVREENSTERDQLDHESEPPRVVPVTHVDEYRWSAAELYAESAVMARSDARTPRPPSAAPMRAPHRHSMTRGEESPSPPPVPTLRELYLMDHTTPSAPRTRPSSAARPARHVVLGAPGAIAHHGGDAVVVFAHPEPNVAEPAVARSPGG